MVLQIIISVYCSVHSHLSYVVVAPDVVGVIITIRHPVYNFCFAVRCINIICVAAACKLPYSAAVYIISIYLRLPGCCVYCVTGKLFVRQSRGLDSAMHNIAESGIANYKGSTFFYCNFSSFRITQLLSITVTML